MPVDSKSMEILTNFCDKVKTIHSEDESITKTINKFMKLSEVEKSILVQNFYDKFTLVPNGQELLNNNKAKLFSSKEEETHQLSLSLFSEELPLKKIFNNLEGKDKTFLWTSLKVLVHYTKPSTQTKKRNPILNMDVDENVNEMIGDIVKEFKNTMENKKDGGNPMESILGVTSKITAKYQDKIQSGEIKLDNLVSDLQNSMPGMKNIMDKLIPKNKPKVQKEKVIIDENFSTDKVVVGEDKPSENNVDLTKMLPMLNGLGGGDFNKLAKDMLGSEFGDMLNTMNPENVKSMSKEELKNMKTKMDKMMKDKFNIDLSKNL